MQYSDTTTKQGLVEDTRFWADTDSTAFPIADVTRSINFALDKYTAQILAADGRWQWDDTNNTNNPIGSADLVNGQGLYGMDDSMLTVERVEVSDSAGNWTKLEPVDRNDLDVAIDEFQKTNGIPRYYDKKARSIELYPAPNYALTSGLKIYFSRAMGHFQATDTTKEPGFAQPFHRLLSLSAALDYCQNKKQDRVPALLAQITKMEEEMEEFYSRRNEDKAIVMQVRSIGESRRGRRYFSNSDNTPRI